MRAPMAGSFRPLLAGLISTHDKHAHIEQSARRADEREVRPHSGLIDRAPLESLRDIWRGTVRIPFRESRTMAWV